LTRYFPSSAAVHSYATDSMMQRIPELYASASPLNLIPYHRYRRVGADIPYPVIISDYSSPFSHAGPTFRVSADLFHGSSRKGNPGTSQSPEPATVAYYAADNCRCRISWLFEPPRSILK